MMKWLPWLVIGPLGALTSIMRREKRCEGRCDESPVAYVKLFPLNWQRDLKEESGGGYCHFLITGLEEIVHYCIKKCMRFM